MSSPANDSPADRANYIGAYPLLELIGKGGMGEVWLSEHPNLHCPVAIKILDNTLAQENEDYIQNFITEGQLAATLIDPNIVRMLDAGEEDGKYFLVMEYIDGCTAEELMKARGGRLPYDEVVQLAVSMCRALEQAQSKGIIHRDVKPDNILVSSEGLLKLADLGIAKRVYSTDGADEAVGTPNYISPEQVITPLQTDYRSDIYSLGVSMFQLISGTVPFSADDVGELAMMHVNNEPPCLKELVPEIPDALVAVIHRMMAKNVEGRYQTYKVLIRDLEAIRDYNVKVTQLDTDTATFAPIKHVAINKPILGNGASKKSKTRADSSSATSSSPLVPVILFLGVILLALVVISILRLFVK